MEALLHQVWQCIKKWGVFKTHQCCKILKCLQNTSVFECLVTLSAGKCLILWLLQTSFCFKCSHIWYKQASFLYEEELTGLFLYLRPYHNPWIKKAKKLLGCAQDFRLENWILVEWIDKTQTLPKLSLENLGRVCVLPIHSTTFQFSNLKSWAHPNNFFAFLIHGLW